METLKALWQHYKTIVFLLLIFLGFYLLYFRPAIIRRECSIKMSQEWTIRGGISEAHYKECVRQKGIKE